MSVATTTASTTCTVVAHYHDDLPHLPKNEMESEMMMKLTKMGFKPYQIRIMFERFRAGKLMLEIENVQLNSQLHFKSSPREQLMKVMSEKYHIDFKNDQPTNRMRGVRDLQRYVKYLESNSIDWTYINVYDGNSKLKIGSLYSDEPIPKRMIE